MAYACAVTAAVLALTFSTSLDVQFSLPKLLALRACATLIGVLWISRARRGVTRGVSAEVALGALALLTWWIVTTVTAVHVPTAVYGATGRYNGLLTQATLMFIALAIATSGLTRTEVSQAIRWVVAALIPASLYAVAQFAGLDPIEWPGPRSASTVGNPVILAATLGLAVPPAVAFALLARKGTERLAWIAVLFVLLAGMASTLSRGPLLAVFVSMSVVALAYFRDAPHRVRVRIAAIAVVTLIVAAGGYWQVVQTRARLFGVEEPGRTLTDRSYTYAVARRIIEEHPLRGVGLENVANVYPAYRIPASEQLTPDVLPTMVHSGYLQLAATTGVVGLIFYLLFLIAIFTTLWRAWQVVEHRDRLLLSALIASIAGYLIQDITGWQEISLSTLFYLVLGLVLAYAQAIAPGQATTPRRVGIAVVGIASVLCGLLTIEAAETVRVDRLVHGARRADVSGQWPEIATRLEAVTDTWVRLPAEYFDRAGLRHAERYALTGSADHHAEAARLFDEARQRNPFSVLVRLHLLSLDAVAIRKGIAVPEADARAAEVIEADPSNGSVYETVARLRMAQHRYDEAVAMIDAARALRPGAARIAELRGDLEHERGNTPAALAAYREAVDGYEGDEHVLWAAASGKLALAQMAAGQAGDAANQAERVLTAFPRDVNMYVVLGYARLALGDRDRARTAFQSALILQPGQKAALEGLAAAR